MDSYKDFHTVKDLKFDIKKLQEALKQVLTKKNYDDGAGTKYIASISLNQIPGNPESTKGENAKSSQPTLGFQRVLQRSVFHVQSSGKGLVKHINILVAIFSEKESHAVYLLTKHGVSRLDIVTFISHGKKSKKENVSPIFDTELTVKILGLLKKDCFMYIIYYDTRLDQ